jgi:shikimate kinase
MNFKRIFLVGFRTTGKTTIGKILAEKINWSFLDMDFLITQEAGKDVATLTKNGTDWSKFRKIENEVLYEISKMENVVVSCGGGVGVNNVIDQATKKTFGDLNREILKHANNSLVVLLTSEEENIRERLKRQYKNKKIMPFLNQENAKLSENEKDENILIEKQIDDSIATYQERKPLYEKLTKIKIDTDKMSLEKTAEEIINYVK